MGEPGRGAALAMGALLVIAGVLGGFLRQEGRPERLELDPEVGRSARQVQAGGDPTLRAPAPVSGVEREAERRAAVFAMFDGATTQAMRTMRPAAVVVHPFAGELPGETREDGPPWHLVLQVAGGVTPGGPRWAAGQPGGPSWMKPGDAREALHLAIPRAGSFGDARRRHYHDLLAWLLDRFALRAGDVRFATDHVGAPAWPEGVDREALAVPEGLR